MPQDGSLWAITSYFNPCGYQRRLQNYRIFRQRLDAPLVAVELAYGGAEFQLQQGDAEILIQLRGQDVMWQKEQLLNLAIQQLPNSCRQVAWLDADIIFKNADWSARAVAALEHRTVIQLFRDVYDLPPDFRSGLDPLRGRYAGVSYMSSPAEHRQFGYGPWVYDTPTRDFGIRTGFAFAARADLIREYLLYGACILGAGDVAFVGAAMGNFDLPIQQVRMNPAWAEHFACWAEKLCVAVDGKFGCLAETIFHLWHGSATNRRLEDRHIRLEPFQFDPSSDIAAADNGCWRWNSGKPEMHEYVRQYFASRREDG